MQFTLNIDLSIDKSNYYNGIKKPVKDLLAKEMKKAHHIINGWDKSYSDGIIVANQKEEHEVKTRLSDGIVKNTRVDINRQRGAEKGKLKYWISVEANYDDTGYENQQIVNDVMTMALEFVNDLERENNLENVSLALLPNRSRANIVIRSKENIVELSKRNFEGQTNQDELESVFNEYRE